MRAPGASVGAARQLATLRSPLSGGCSARRGWSIEQIGDLPRAGRSAHRPTLARPSLSPPTRFWEIVRRVDDRIRVEEAALAHRVAAAAKRRAMREEPDS